MKKRRLAAIAALLATVLLLGCDSVDVGKPFGEPLNATALQHLEGVWIDDDKQTLEVRVVRKELHLGMLTWNEKKRTYEVDKLKVLATQVGSDQLFFLRGEENTEEAGRYAFARFELERGKRLRIWLPSVERFQQAVREKKVSAEISKKRSGLDVRVRSTPEELVAELKAESGGLKPEYFEAKPSLSYQFLRSVN